MDSKDVYEASVKIFDSQQSLITATDNKASISLAIQLFVVTTVFGASIITESFNKTYPSLIFNGFKGFAPLINFLRPKYPSLHRNSFLSDLGHFVQAT